VTDSRQTRGPAGQGAATTVDDRTRLLPPRILPLVYFGAARVAFLCALLALAWEPTIAAGFFYHPRLVAAVHLVTIGWLTFSIYASLYIVGPLALRIALPARATDYAVCVMAVLGLVGAVGRFWRNDIASAGWWAALVLPAAVLLAGRLWMTLPRAPVQPAVKLHIALAFANFFAAAALGVMIGLDRARDVLPAPALSNVYAHAHVAAVGWVGMLAVGIGYRLFPMVLPSAMPEGRSLYLSAVLIETGLLLLAMGLLLLHPRIIAPAALLVGAGFGSFLLQARRMLARRRPPPVAMPWPDYGALQALASLCWLATAIALGVYLALAPMSELTVRLSAAYGVLALVGFFAQLVAGMEYRILPLFAWYWAFAHTDFKGPVPNPHTMPIAGVQRACFYLWLAGVPLVALGAAWPLPRLVSAGASLLVLAVAAGAIDAAAIASYALRKQRVTGT
jgi:hypothetical protein